MRTFKTKPFARFAYKAGISNAALCRAVRDAERGLLAADLGGAVIKQRIARPGHGKAGGFRTLIVFRASVRAIFVHVFAKNEKTNIEEGELPPERNSTVELLSYDEKTIARVVASGVLLEMSCDEKTRP